MIAPMMHQAQDGLKVQSNTIFNAKGGENPLDRPGGAPAGINQAPPSMPGMGGMGGGAPR